MKSHLLLLGLGLTLFGLCGCQAPTTVLYRTSAFLEKDSGFSRQSKIAFELDPDAPIEFRRQLEKVEPAAKAAGLNCTGLSEAEFVVVLATDTYSHPPPGKGYTVFGIQGRAYRLTDEGKRRLRRSAWDGSASGMKDIIHDFDSAFAPPWVEVDQVVANFVACLGIEKPNSG